VLQSEYNFCLSPSRPLLLQSEYNFCLSPSRILLPQSECTFFLNFFFYRFTPTLSEKSVCGQLLIRNILVLLFNFEVPLKKIIKKSCSKKRKRKKQQQRRGFVCVFLSFVWWCFEITFVSRLASQLAFFANVVLVLPCLLLSATYSSTYIPTAASQGFSCQH
jgi:hypothetical protein